VKKLKTMNSHAGLARWLAEVSEEPVGWLPRVGEVGAIPSPYRYSSTVAVWNWNGKQVVWFETRHKYYEVFEVPAEAYVYRAEAAAGVEFLKG
jgi:hypothetical protein